MPSTAPRVSERSKGQMVTGNCEIEIKHWITLGGFYTAVFLFSFWKWEKGGDGSGGKGDFELPQSTHTSLNYCHFSNDASITD